MPLQLRDWLGLKSHILQTAAVCTAFGRTVASAAVPWTVLEGSARLPNVFVLMFTASCTVQFVFRCRHQHFPDRFFMWCA